MYVALDKLGVIAITGDCGAFVHLQVVSSP